MSVDTVVKKVDSVENNNKPSPMDSRLTTVTTNSASEDNLEKRCRLLEGILANKHFRTK